MFASPPIQINVADEGLRRSLVGDRHRFDDCRRRCLFQLGHTIDIVVRVAVMDVGHFVRHFRQTLHGLELSLRQSQLSARFVQQVCVVKLPAFRYGHFAI